VTPRLLFARLSKINRHQNASHMRFEKDRREVFTVNLMCFSDVSTLLLGNAVYPAFRYVSLVNF
jgi:hypothetical protein